MSPIPSPTPLRRVFARLLFSPAGLLCGFVVLLVLTCPGARGAEGAKPISPHSAIFGSSATVVNLGFQPTAAATPTPRRAIGRSTRFDRAPEGATTSASAARRGSAAPSSRGLPQTDLPLFVDSLLGTTASKPESDISPMTGPPVGVRTLTSFENF